MKKTSLSSMLPGAAALAAALLLGGTANAQDVISINNGLPITTGSPNGTITVPIQIRDRSALSTLNETGTNGTGNEIQGIALKVLFPSGSVSSASIVRAGVCGSPVAALDIPSSGPTFVARQFAFTQPNSPAFNLDAIAPGDICANLQITFSATPGFPFSLTLDPSFTQLDSNFADAALTENSANGRLTLVNVASVTPVELTTFTAE